MKNIKIHFIEYMENRHANENFFGMHGREIINHILKKYDIKALKREGSSSLFNYKIIENKFGMIDPHKHDFCENCNRIRSTKERYLISCLYFFNEAISIAEAIKAKNIKKASEILGEVLKNRPKENRWSENDKNLSTCAFYYTGG